MSTPYYPKESVVGKISKRLAQSRMPEPSLQPPDLIRYPDCPNCGHEMEPVDRDLENFKCKSCDEVHKISKHDDFDPGDHEFR